jgi:hypothetical protein
VLVITLVTLRVQKGGDSRWMIQTKGVIFDGSYPPLAKFRDEHTPDKPCGQTPLCLQDDGCQMGGYQKTSYYETSTKSITSCKRTCRKVCLAGARKVLYHPNVTGWLASRKAHKAARAAIRTGEPSFPVLADHFPVRHPRDTMRTKGRLTVDYTERCAAMCM